MIELPRRPWLALSWWALMVLAGCGGGGPSGTPDASQSPQSGSSTSSTTQSSGSGSSSSSGTSSSSGGTGQGTVTGTSSGSSAASGCTIPRGGAGPAVFAAAHPKILVNHAPTLLCLQQLLNANATSATRFKAYVDSEIAHPGSNWGFQNWFVALMYQVSGQASYADFAVAKVDAFVASEEALIAAGQVPTVAGDSYLDVGPLVGDVALVYDWCYPRLTPSQRSRWIAYMNQAVWNVWNPTQATWGTKPRGWAAWSGWSVNNPSNNYYYSFLRATMLVGLGTLGDNPSAQGWIDEFRTTKISQQLMPTFTSDLVGGGSREGTGYGTAMKNLFQLYDWWERSTGERIATGTSHTLASTAWLTHSIVPTLDFLVATGDQSRDSSVALFGYHREYLLSLISLFPQERLSAVAKLTLDASSLPTMANGFEFFADYLYQPPALPSAAVTDLTPTYWAPGSGQLLMRSAWGDKTAAFSNLICGPYTESHAHRDQGSFQLYRGEWLAPTDNIYTHSGIEQREEFNNLVRIELNGSTIRQVVSAPQCNMVALADSDAFTYSLADVTPIYNAQTPIKKVEREYLFIKPATFVVFDRVKSDAGTRRIWTLNLPATPTLNGDHLTFTGAKSNRLDVYRLAPTGLSYQVMTPVLTDSTDFLTNTNVKRIDVVDTVGTQSNFLHVLGTNGSVSAVTRSDASGQTGVQIQLADGRVAIVRFNNDARGGTLDLRQASGTVQFNASLPTTVVVPPLFRN